MSARSRNSLIALIGAAFAIVLVLLFIRATEEARADDAAVSAARTAEQATATELADDPTGDPLAPAVRSKVDATKPAAPTEAPVTASKRPQTIVYGSLLDAAGEPIRSAGGAGVSFTDHVGRRRVVDAKDEGAYAIHALPFGTYWISASASGFRRVEETLELQSAQPIVQRDFTLQKAPTLRIKLVTPQGALLADELKQKKPLLSLVPVATREHPGKRFTDVTGSLNNTFGIGSFRNYGPEFEKLPAGYTGLLVLTEDLPAFVSLVLYHEVLETQRVEPGTEEIVFVLAPERLTDSLATIRLRAIDAETGTPIEGARAMVWGTSFGDGGVPTGADGVAAIKDQVPGSIVLRLMSKDYEMLRRVVEVQPALVTDLGDLLLDKAVTVEGRTVDDKGNGVATQLSLGHYDPTSRAIEIEREIRHTSDANGAFKLAGLGRKLYVLRTSNHDALNDSERDGTTWVSGNVLVDARAGAVAKLEVRLVPATLLMLKAADEEPDALRFRVTDAEGLVLAASRFYGPAPRALKLPRGTYHAALLGADDSVLDERTVHLGAELVELELAR